MNRQPSLSRRQLLKRLALGTSIGTLGTMGLESALAAEAPLLAIDAPEAKAVHYVEDATKASAAKPGSSCATCGLYQGPTGSARGPCQLFPGKDVKASGWCDSWVPQM